MNKPLTLQSIWPRPDWSTHINDERTDDVLRTLDAIYDQLRETPRTNEGDISNDDWKESFVSSVTVLRALFRKTNTIEQADAINQRFAERLLVDYTKAATLPLEQSYHYWAISKKDLSDQSNDAIVLTRSENLTKSKSD